MFEVLATSGDTHLGGDDFDKRIVDYLIREFKNNEGIDLSKDKQALQVRTLPRVLVMTSFLGHGRRLSSLSDWSRVQNRARCECALHSLYSRRHQQETHTKRQLKESSPFAKTYPRSILCRNPL